MTEYPIGTSDFSAYWSAFQVFLAGGNPYDESALRAVQLQIIPNLKETQMFINPPWAIWMLFVFLAPLTYLPFKTAALLWLTANFGLLLLSAWMLYRYFQPHNTPWRYVFLTSFCFLPALACVNSGQLSLLVCSCLFAALLALKNNKDYLAGALLVPLTLKPQLAYMILAALAVYLIKNNRWKVILSGLVIFSLFSLPICEASKVLYEQWLSQEFNPNLWRTSTLSTPIRAQAIEKLAYDPWWLGFATSGIASLFAITWAIREKEINWRKSLPYLAALSLIFAPYAWVFDYSLLLCISIWALCSFYQDQKLRRELLCWLVFSQISLLLVSAGVESLEHFAFFPILMLFFCLRFGRLSSCKN